MKPHRTSAKGRIIKTLLAYLYLLLISNLALADPPDWEPPNNLQYNMQVVAQLQLPDETISMNENDMVAAFVAGECRGIASPLPDVNGIVFLSIGSNEVSGEIITFKAYLAENDDIVSLNESFMFENQGEVGEYLDPFLFTVNPDGPIFHIITASSGNYGAINPSGEIEIENGANQVFEFLPDAGYVVEHVMINGESIGSPDFYEFTNVTSDQSIHVTFALPAFLADKTRQEVDFEAYPNPFIRDLTFEIESTRSQDKNLYLQITDNTGHILIAQTIKKSPLRISLANYPSGHYFMHLFENERLIGTKKIIKVNY